MKLRGIIAVLLVAACGPNTSTTSLARPEFVPLADAPYEPANDRDLDDMRDRYEAMDIGDSARAPLRRALADEYARRLALAVASAGEHKAGYGRLIELVSLWRTPELAAMSDPELIASLGPYVSAAQAMRDYFARAGGDVQAAAALFFLAMADPGRRAEYRAELDEIFLYADDLARSQFGDGAERSRTIAILEQIVAAAPMPEAVDRLTELYVTRQKELRALFDRDGLSSELVHAHGESMFKTASRLVGMLARAGRLDSALALIDPIEGLGRNVAVNKAVHAALAPGAGEAAWLELAALYQDEKHAGASDGHIRWRTVMAICVHGSQRVPNSAELPRCAGSAARQLDMLHVSIRFYEQALAIDPTLRRVTEVLADMYRVRVDTLALYERPLAAKKRMAELEAFHNRAAERWPKKPLETDLADAFVSMGRAMVTLGELADARVYLEKSLALRATIRALEQLGNVALKQDRFAEAIRYYDRALRMDSVMPVDRFYHARILRHAGDALHRNGEVARARSHWRQADREWADINDSLHLAASFKAESFIEVGKARWALGARDIGLLAFDVAVDIDPGGVETLMAVIAFLVVRGEYERALDTYHRALGNPGIDENSKVYMSLWMRVEERRTRREPDPLVAKFLATRAGPLWHHALARYAAGLLDRDALRSHAKTRGHQAEFLYYTAILDSSRSPREVRAQLEQVVATDMVIYFEYDMAKYWLFRGFTPREQAAKRTAR